MANTIPGSPESRMTSERRTLTVLFCDVVSSTAMAEQLDPEEWTEIMNGAFQHLTAPISRYDGTVSRLLGDAVLALFGAPVAHEDDPERAVLAALDMLVGMAPFREQVSREYGMDFDVRIGINTGPVVVGDVGSAAATEYTAMGDAVNVAARMEQTAQPGPSPPPLPYSLPGSLCAARQQRESASDQPVGNKLKLFAPARSSLRGRTSCSHCRALRTNRAP